MFYREAYTAVEGSLKELRAKAQEALGLERVPISGETLRAVSFQRPTMEVLGASFEGIVEYRLRITNPVADAPIVFELMERIGSLWHELGPKGVGYEFQPSTLDGPEKGEATHIGYVSTLIRFSYTHPRTV